VVNTRAGPLGEAEKATTAMAITPDEIENRVFSLVRRGYDPAEVDDFLKDVASTLAQAQGGLATPPAPPATDDRRATAGAGADDFGRLGEEVAAILRQAHESVDSLRQRAEAEAAVIRQDAEREAEAMRQEADADRQAAAIALEAARAEVDRTLAELARQADLAAEAAAARAQERSRQVIEAARLEARGAVTVQRNVRVRLEDTREDIDQALDHLIDEDTDLFETIDLTDTALAEDAVAAPAEPERVPPPGQGPPTPPVPPPTRTTPLAVEDLPYATDDDEEEPAEDTAPGPIDLTDAVTPERPEAGPDVASLPPVPPPPPGFDDDRDGGAAAEAPAAATDPDEDDPLAQMVKNAVENALKRRKGDGEAPEDGT
jgi:DivIVA domain-containing protein